MSKTDSVDYNIKSFILQFKHATDVQSAWVYFSITFLGNFSGDVNGRWTRLHKEELHILYHD